MSSYLSLVAQSGQVNTPPGSYRTVKEWIREALIGPSSEVLEVGCSNGFIAIETARYSGARCTGLDLHPGSIAAARSNIDAHVGKRVSFVEGDAGKLPFADRTFSHTIIGGHLPFIEPAVRRAHIAEAVRVTKPWGYVLTALFYYSSPPPHVFVDEFNAAIGTRLDPTHDYTYWSALFDSSCLTLEYESVHEVMPASSDRIAAYESQFAATAARDAWAKNLRLFNENGKYLRFFVRAYRVTPEVPGLPEQKPRGGIYESRRLSKQRF